MPAVSFSREAQSRLQQRIERVSRDLFKMLDEAREYGATYLALELHRERPNGETEAMTVVLADPQVSITNVPPSDPIAAG